MNGCSRSVFYLGKVLVSNLNHSCSKITSVWSVSLDISRFSTVKLKNKSVTSTGSIQEEWHDRIIYNEILYRKKTAEYVEQRLTDGSKTKAPLILKYLINDDSNSNEGNSKLEGNATEESPVVQFPFELQSSVIDPSFDNTTDDRRVIDNPNKYCLNDEQHYHQIKRAERMGLPLEPEHRWLRSQEDARVEILFKDYRFGTADPKIPHSSVPCGGCGALLHCADMSIPGFIPKEIFVDLSERDLGQHICQRCLFLQQYDVAIDINVDQKEYPKIMSTIKNTNSLVLLMVDLLDFPCSIWPNVLDIIGSKTHVFLVGNKLDLVLQDGTGYMKHIKECLQEAALDVGISKKNVKHTALISAKTGYGIESLISALHTSWGTKGDVYIVGCTNAGKSTLFNALIQSDYCKIQAVDILQRATVSNWPGTTINLLKFPILKLDSYRLYIRKNRLKQLERDEKDLRNYRMQLAKSTGNDPQISLIGYIGRSFHNETDSETAGLTVLDPNDPAFKLSKWCYDTPGVMHEDQILNLLTTAELSKTLPKEMIIPRNFKMFSGQTLFIGGLARLDFIHGYKFVWFTVFASAELPVTIANTEDADFIYEKLLGTEFFGVPFGSDERMEKWPPLASKDFEVCGKSLNVASSDIVLSSAGWVAVTVQPGYACKLRCWTPNARGIHRRTPALIRKSSSFRGEQIINTPAFTTSVEVV